jgi:xylan 1,4-beta-xylosidase
MSLISMCLWAGYVRADAGTFTNPIIPGGHPDPSICRVGDDYYIVNSSFEYFPGLPIHHSRNLVDWDLVGYGLQSESQIAGTVNLVDVQSNGGIHAPSIRFHDGLFYIITTNVYSPTRPGAPTEFVNFIITSRAVEGPWSAPHVIAGAPGIDPDIFFDTDGRVWYVGTHQPDKPDFDGEGEIWLQELDLAGWRLVGERFFLWRGACGGTWAEGPHLYQHDGRYYLLVAEGGTSFDHAVTIATSDRISGPYLSNPRNPILTSRNLTYDNWVNSTGHADIVELADGRWYMVSLGIRGDNQRRSNMGRETFLIPVTWEREPYEWKQIKLAWPVAAPLTGRVERFTPLPFPDRPQIRRDVFRDEFDSASLGLEWNFRRVPKAGTYSLTARPGFLRLFADPNVITERGRASLLGIRQQESSFEYTVRMAFAPAGTVSEAGISLFQKDDNYLNVAVAQDQGKKVLRLVVARRGGPPTEQARQDLGSYTGKIVFRVASDNRTYRFSYSVDEGKNFHSFTEVPADRILSNGYTGAYLGLYSTSNGQNTQDYADYDWVSCQWIPSAVK